jgi:HTH-type transcriptional regulator/antitoxin HigA
MSTLATAYEELIREFPLRPIRSDRQLSRASAVASRLAVKSRLSSSERDYLEVLSTLIEHYEDETLVWDGSTAAELLAFLLKENDLSPATVGTATGIRPTVVTELMSGRREFNLSQVRMLSRYFRVSPALFVGSA